MNGHLAKDGEGECLQPGLAELEVLWPDRVELVWEGSGRPGWLEGGAARGHPRPVLGNLPVRRRGRGEKRAPRVQLF